VEGVDYGEVDWDWPMTFVKMKRNRQRELKEDAATDHSPLGTTGAAKDAPKTDDADDRISETPGEPMLTVPYGLGKVTLVPSLRPWTNMRIDHGRHAALWHDLINEESTKICFVRGSGVSLMSLIWEKGWRIVLAVLASIFCWIWASSKRFGLRPKPFGSDLVTAEGSLLATGAFLFRERLVTHLITPWRERLVQRWKQRRPDSLSLTDQDFIRWAAESCQVTQPQISQCFHSPDRINARQFLAITRLLYKIERHIHLSPTV
jgi:hypothetical protein